MLCVLRQLTTTFTWATKLHQPRQIKLIIVYILEHRIHSQATEVNKRTASLNCNYESH